MVRDLAVGLGETGLVLIYKTKVARKGVTLQQREA